MENTNKNPSTVSEFLINLGILSEFGTSLKTGKTFSVNVKVESNGDVILNRLNKSSDKSNPWVVPYLGIKNKFHEFKKETFFNVRRSRKDVNLAHNFQIKFPYGQIVYNSGTLSLRSIKDISALVKELQKLDDIFDIQGGGE